MHRSDSSNTTIAVLGGTGELGSGLAIRWAQAGYDIVIGSRDAEKASQTADAIRSNLPESNNVRIDGMSNNAAAIAGKICVLTVPFQHQAATLDDVKASLQGKILVDATVPLMPPRVARVQLPHQGSAGTIAQQILGDDVEVVSAFQNVSAVTLATPGDIDCDVIVCGNKKAARATVINLIEAIGLRGFHGGSIANSAATEALTSILIFINKHYGGHAGISITGTKHRQTRSE